MASALVYVNVGPIVGALVEVRNGLFDRQVLLQMGMFVRFQIEKRTAAGKGVDGAEFVPYSPQYRLFRERTGHPTTKVNLFYTGSMMSAMTVEAQAWVYGKENEVRIYFLNTTDRKGVPNPAKAFYLDQDRHFFGMSKEDVEGVTRIYESHISRLLGGKK
jgi:hypothetical protein